MGIGIRRAATHSLRAKPLIMLGSLTMWTALAVLMGDRLGQGLGWTQGAQDGLRIGLVVLPLWAGWMLRHRARRQMDEAARLALRNRLLSLEGIATYVADGVVICEAGDLAGPDSPRIIEVNDAQCRICGYARHELIGRTPRLLQGPETDRATLDRIRAALEAGREVREDLVNYAKDGRPYWVEIQISPVVDPETGTLYFVSVQRDVTERKRLERELTEAKEQAERSDRAKAMFLATMSHDLRTPLNAVLGFSDLILSELHGPVGHPRYKEYAQDIHASGRQLLRLVESILEVSKGDLGQLTVRKEAMDLVELCRAQSAAFRPLATRHDIGLFMELPASLPIQADEVLLGRAIGNLVSNAIRFTDPGGRVRLALVSEPDGPDGAPGAIRVIVTDTGQGIAPDALANLGTPFYRPEGTAALARDGHGLGLAIVRLIAQRHGGRMEIESRLGEGTQVQLVLPGTLRRTDAPARTERPVLAAE